MTKPTAAVSANASLPSDEPMPAVLRGPRCGWCHAPITYKPVGRRRKYCSHTCRQRAYIQRKTNRAADWVEYKEAIHQRLRARLHFLTDEWGNELHHPTFDAATQLSKLWDDIWHVTYRHERDEYGRRASVVLPRHRRPAYRDIGDRPVRRPVLPLPCPYVGTFDYAALRRAVNTEARDQRIDEADPITPT